MDSFRFAFLFQLSSCRRRSLTNQTCFSYRWPTLPFQFNALFGLNTCFLLLQKISQLYLRGAAWVCTIDFVSDGGLSLCADCDCLVPSVCCQYLKHDGCTYFLEWEWIIVGIQCTHKYVVLFSYSTRSVVCEGLIILFGIIIDASTD